MTDDAQVMPAWPDVTLREYVEARLAEHARLLDTLAEERRHALLALGEKLARETQGGDERLREQLVDEMKRLDEALTAAQRLELERIERLTSQLESTRLQLAASIEALRHEREITTREQQRAIEKAQTATEKRFESVNEFRAQLSDQAAAFIPREVAEATSAELRQQIQSTADRLNTLQGKSGGEESLRERWLAATVVLVAVVAAISPHIH